MPEHGGEVATSEELKSKLAHISKLSDIHTTQTLLSWQSFCAKIDVMSVGSTPPLIPLSRLNEISVHIIAGLIMSLFFFSAW